VIVQLEERDHGHDARQIGTWPRSGKEGLTIGKTM
jgi:hypothetical protein